ncbi:MAG: hypothetical protein H5T86_14680 [Armatimonadetes bacterium]|nr:hypothetical protein [Armatimonadota bacterium]
MPAVDLLAGEAQESGAYVLPVMRVLFVDVPEVGDCFGLAICGSCWFHEKVAGVNCVAASAP